MENQKQNNSNQTQSTNETMTDSNLNKFPIFSFLDKKNKTRLNTTTNNENNKSQRLTQSKKENPEYEVEILSHKVMQKEFVIYQIKVKRGNQYWIFQTRYSLLSSLNSKLSKQISAQIPKFPQKKLFGNLEQRFIEKRSEQLNSYLQMLFKVGRNDHSFKEFLRQSRTAAIQINDPSDVKHFKLDA